jgi:hypothetical protein
MASSPWKPWHQVVQFRDDLKTGELSLAVFAADLYDVVKQEGARPVYEDAVEHFNYIEPAYRLTVAKYTNLAQAPINLGVSPGASLPAEVLCHSHTLDPRPCLGIMITKHCPTDRRS